MRDIEEKVLLEKIERLANEFKRVMTGDTAVALSVAVATAVNITGLHQKIVDTVFKVLTIEEQILVLQFANERVNQRERDFMQIMSTKPADTMKVTCVCKQCHKICTLDMIPVGCVHCGGDLQQAEINFPDMVKGEAHA